MDNEYVRMCHDFLTTSHEIRTFPLGVCSNYLFALSVAGGSSNTVSLYLELAFPDVKFILSACELRLGLLPLWDCVEILSLCPLASTCQAALGLFISLSCVHSFFPHSFSSTLFLS